MTNLFIAYVAAFLLPMLFHSWRVAVIGLGVQGIILGLICIFTHEFSSFVLIETFTLLAIRGVLVPWVLFRRMRGHELPSNFSLIKKSLAHWILAILLVVAAFMFGNRMSDEGTSEALQVGVASSAILIGLLVLSNQKHPLGQIVGLLTFEGGVTIVELLSPHVMPFPVYALVSLVFVAFVLTSGQYLANIVAITEEEDSTQSRFTL